MQWRSKLPLASSPGSLLKTGGRRESDNICEKSCRLLARHHSCDHRRTSKKVLCHLAKNKWKCNGDPLINIIFLFVINNLIALPHPDLCHVCIFSQMAKNLQSLPNLFHMIFDPSPTKLNQEGLLHSNCLPAINANCQTFTNFLPTYNKEEAPVPLHSDLWDSS